MSMNKSNNNTRSDNINSSESVIMMKKKDYNNIITDSDNINSSESVIMMKKKDYNNIIDKIVDNQHTIDVWKNKHK
jgi:hypothetical protein